MDLNLMPQFADTYTAQDGSERVAKLFRLTFGAAPEGTYRAPGRVNVIGEHTDYNGGVAMPLALPHATYAAVSPRKDRRLRLVSAQMNEPIELDLDDFAMSLTDKIPEDGSRVFKGPGAYVGGTILGLEDVLKISGEFPGFDVAIDSCVPLGSGLSSSAALECAVAVAVDDLQELGLAGSIAGRRQLLEAGRRAENFYVGAPTGGLDQAAALLCSPEHVILLDCRTFEAESCEFNMGAKGLELLVIDTKARHDLADGQYAKRRQTCEVAAAAMGVEFLGDLVPAGENTDVGALLGQLREKIGDTEIAQEVFRRARHVLTEIVRTRDFAAELQGEGCPDELGHLMNASHDSLREDYEVTCQELDVAVDSAREVGAYGARMTGGGFGGCAIALVEADEVEKTARAVMDAFAREGLREPSFLLAEPSAAAEKL